MLTAVVAIDVFAVILVLIGFHIAFRQRLVRDLLGRPLRDAPKETGEPDPMASVFRIVGVMIMAFAITICTFANLIAYYSRSVA